jgi:hypothetical protein
MHQFHEATSLSISKVQEGQPKLKVFQPFLGGEVQRSPPGLDGKVPRFCLKHRGYVAILESKTLVLVLQVVFDIELGVFLQRLGPMEVACSLASIHENLRISRPVDNPHGIPIGLRTVSHKSFEVKLGNSMPSHDVVKVVPEKHLSILVLRLEVTASDGHDALVGSVVNVTCHGDPLGDAFDMVGHDPSMLKISARLHALNQVDPTTGADLGHLENKNFVCIVTLVWELIPLDICRAPLQKGCPKHHGHKGDPRVTPGTCGADGEKAQV